MPLPSYASSWRAFAGRVFAVFAFGVTFLGLAILVIFFVRLGLDVHAWFRTMPGLVQERNAELAASVARAKDTKVSVDQRLREIDQEMADELKAAPDEAARAQIRQDYAGFKVRELEALEITNRELMRGEEDIRLDTSPAALLHHFLTAGPSSQPEDAGIQPALLGSLLLVLITIVTAMPLGVGAAIYLEEYRQNSRLARFIQVNINNLAGVPSVMYGILGAYLFVELLFKKIESDTIAARNVLGGGLTLALLTLPVIIVSSQEAIRAVPVSLRHASLALGATRWQTIARIVLPSALPGILTGMILAMCRAMGEAAPLVLFGALLFVNHNPTLFSRFTVLPMQIFGWSDRPGVAWQYNAAMASTLLVVTLLALNATAITLRQRAQRKLRG
jgi:phosphate transport system permease protein